MTTLGLLQFQSIADVAGFLYMAHVSFRLGLFLGEYFSTHPDQLWLFRVLLCVLALIVLSWVSICFFNYTLADFFKGLIWVLIPSLFFTACKLCVNRSKSSNRKKDGY